MRSFNLAMLLMGSALIFSGVKKPDLYQVISSHPHDVAEFSPYIKTVTQEGRLWLVQLKKNIPQKFMKFFQSTTGRNVNSYFAAYKSAGTISSTIKDFTERAQPSAIKNNVKALTKFKTRLAGSTDNQKATREVAQTLSALGYSVSELCYRPEACSLIADKIGAGSSSDILMIMGHIDSVGKDFAGADDNASGTAVLLEIARILKDYSNKKTIRFFVTNGEESGLLGASHYAKLLSRTGEIKRLNLAINMDMVGYNSNGIVELETDKQYEPLARWFVQLAGAYTKLKTKVTIGAWGSDHVPFIKSGVPTLLTIEDWSTKTPCYHQACDTPDTLNYEYAGEVAKLNIAAILTKDQE